MKSIKRIFVFVFGLKNYFRIVSRSFFILYRLGVLRSRKSFECHYYIKRLVKEGDSVIDIGANFGYYTILFSDLVKETGHVYAVEPVELYREILLRNAGSRKNITIFPYALGDENKENISMGIPGSDISRHGLTRIITENSDSAKTFTVSMRKPQELFASINKINYIKCDVEGYEMHIIPLILPLIETHHPIIQIETGGENKKQLMSMLEKTGYKIFYVCGEELVPLNAAEEGHEGDLFFMP